MNQTNEDSAPVVSESENNKVNNQLDLDSKIAYFRAQAESHRKEIEFLVPEETKEKKVENVKRNY